MVNPNVANAAILVDNMYLEHVARAFGVIKINMTKLPEVLLEEDENHFRTFVFDALPYVPDEIDIAKAQDDLPCPRCNTINTLGTKFCTKCKLSLDPKAAYIERKNKKKQYLDKLQYLERIAVELGYVRPKRHKCRECNKEFVIPIQKLVDVKLSVRLVSLAWSDIVGTIVLVTGDGDILPAVNAVKDTGTTVRLAYAELENVFTSKSLIRACPEKKILTEQDLSYCKLT